MADRAHGGLAAGAPRSHGRTVLLLLLAALLLGFSIVQPARAEVVSDSDFAPVIWSDKDDYPPGAEVTLSGAHWQPGENVHISVNDDQGKTWSRDVDVTADEFGRITDRFTLPDWFVATYSVKATGESGSVATTTFTDGNIGIKLSGAASGSFGWKLFRANTTCDGTPTQTGTVTFTNGSSSGTEPGANASESVELTAPVISGRQFVSWTSGNQTRTTRVICVVGSQGTQNWTANYETPTVNATSLTVAGASGTYGGSTTLSATLKVGTNGVSGKTVAFTLNGTSAGSATTNGSGVATVTDVSLGSSLKPGTHSGAVAASFAGDATHAQSSGTASLTVAKKELAGSFTVETKTYDAGTSATIASRSLTGKVGTDDVSLTGGTASFASASAGVGKAVTGSGFALDGADKGNYTVAVANSTGTISPKDLTVGFTAAGKTYDGTTAASIATRSLTGKVGSDDVTVSGGQATFANANAGTDKTVTATGFTLGGAAAGNYRVGSVTDTTADITAKGVTGSFTAADKTYDGTTAATISGRILSGKVGTDDVTLAGGTAAFASAAVGTEKTVNGSGFTLGGTAAGNYDLTSVSDAKADIAPKHLAGSFTVADKVYDGTSAATILERSVSGEVEGEDVALTGGTATFASPSAGTGKTVNGTGFTLAGADRGNYTVTVAGARGDITPKRVTGAFTAADKTYDGTTAAGITGRSLTDGVVGSDDVTLTGGTAAFASASAGTGKTVNGSGFSLGGTAAGNYSLGTVADARADIAPKAVTGSFTAADKAYDGTTAATVTGRSIAGKVGADDVSLDGGTASFATAQVGQDKPVSLSGSVLAGTDRANYTLTSVADARADITPKALTGSFTVASKTYDGTTAATITGDSLSGKVAGDDVSLNRGTAAFASAGAGRDKTVNGSGFSLDGADKGNYTLNLETAKADINPRDVAGAFTAADKTYDGTTAATITGRSVTAGIVGSDDVSLTGGNAAFENANAGTAKTVTGTGFTLSGAAAGNYDLTPATLTTTADIRARAITVTADPKSKVYGSPDPTLTYSVTSGALLAGDAFTGSLSRVGGESVAGSPYAIGRGSLSAGGNYDVTFVGSQLSIGKAMLTVEPDPKTDVRQYSDRNATLAPKYAGFVSGDGANVLDTAPTCSTTRTAGSAPGSYPVRCAGGSDDNYGFTYVDGTVTVTREDARAEYTGGQFVSTGGATSSKATVNLAATIRDITAVTGDAATDGDAGDITKARIQFVNRATNAVICSPTVGLVSSSDTRTGTATCSWNVDIGSADSVPYTVGIVVDGHYVDSTGASSDTVVTVSKAIAGMITGGGHLVNSASSGQFAGASGQKTNFGFNVRPNKSGTGLQGNINTIVRNGGRVYQIKGNSMTSLLTKVGTASTAGTATFEGKASIQDVTNPALPISVDGNATLRVTMTDAGEPGTGDKIGITVWNKGGGLWFSSNWSGTNTVEQLLRGGNLVVR